MPFPLPPQRLTALGYVHIYFGTLPPVLVVSSFVSIKHFYSRPFAHFDVEGEISDRVKMITIAFSAFHAVGASITSSQREDVRGVAVLLYSGAYPPSRRIFKLQLPIRAFEGRVFRNRPRWSYTSGAQNNT